MLCPPLRTDSARESRGPIYALLPERRGAESVVARGAGPLSLHEKRKTRKPHGRHRSIQTGHACRPIYGLGLQEAVGLAGCGGQPLDGRKFQSLFIDAQQTDQLAANSDAAGPWTGLVFAMEKLGADSLLTRRNGRLACGEGATGCGEGVGASTFMA